MTTTPPPDPLHYLLIPLKPYESKRSPQWPEVRAKWLAQHPTCAICSTDKVALQVHHIKPFHLFPELELNPTNFMTLCEGTARACHYTFGHFYDWMRYNPKIKHDALIWNKKFLQT